MPDLDTGRRRHRRKSGVERWGRRPPPGQVGRRESPAPRSPVPSRPDDGCCRGLDGIALEQNDRTVVARGTVRTAERASAGLARNRAQRPRWLLSSLAVLGPLFSGMVRADDDPMPIRPPCCPLRYDEDYTYLADRSNRREPLDPLKYIGLARSSYLTIGGEARERYEWYGNALGGFGPEDKNGYFLHRFMLHGDLHLDDHVRVFSQVLSALVSDQTGGPRPEIDEDRLDLHQAFVEATLGGGPRDSMKARLGRQELQYGCSRLIGTREGPNVRLSFDAAKVMLQKCGWSIDAFGGRPVATEPGAWDDHADETQALWGVYATTAVPVLPDGHVDVYYLGFDRKDARFDDGVGHERRQSIGVRAWRPVSPRPWDYDIEGVWQFGDFAGSPIRAWTISSNVGYRPRRLSRVRLSLKADAASGDRSPGDGLQTYNPLFPRASYFGEPALV